MAADRSVLTREARAPDEVVTYGTAPDQVADVRFGDARAEQRPLVLIIHGGFWRPAYDRAHTGPMSEALADAGWTVAAAEYRRIPHDPDTMVRDVALALDVLPTKVKRHNGSVILVGHSAGGHLVLWASVAHRTPQLVGTLALAPVADLLLAHDRQLGDGAVIAFLDTDPKSRADLDPRRLPAPEIPVTIVHGTDDDIVPLEIAESYVATHRHVQLVRVHGADHFAVIDPKSRAWPRVIERLESLAAPPR
jgi:acetyl esterase/lipase